jgi:hypothetical protein
MIKQLRHIRFTMLCDTKVSPKGDWCVNAKAEVDNIGGIQENSIPIRPCCV